MIVFKVNCLGNHVLKTAFVCSFQNEMVFKLKGDSHHEAMKFGWLKII